MAFVIKRDDRYLTNVWIDRDGISDDSDSSSDPFDAVVLAECDFAQRVCPEGWKVVYRLPRWTPARSCSDCKHRHSHILCALSRLGSLSTCYSFRRYGACRPEGLLWEKTDVELGGA